MRWGAIIAGALGLAVLEAVVSRTSAASNVGGLLGGVGTIVRGFISPQVPAFNTSSSSSSSSGGNIAQGIVPGATIPAPSSSPTKVPAPTIPPGIGLLGRLPA